MIRSRQIEAFRAVMLTGTMTGAAEAIHVTQPAVSRLIRDLEAETGLSLFERRGNAVMPTGQAHALLEEVERSFIGLRQIGAFAEDLRMGRSGSLRVAALPAMAAGFMPRFVAEFSRRRPDVKILVEGQPSPTIRDGVVAGLFDIGVTSFPFRRDLLAVDSLRDNAVVAIPSGHKLAQRRAVRAEDLNGESLILLTKFRLGHHPVEVALQSVRGKTMIETSLSTIACTLVSEGIGVAIVDPFSGSEFVGKGLTLRAFEPVLHIGSAVVHSMDRALSPVAEEFREAFLAHVRQFLGEARYLSDGSQISRG
jgi:DNA-binding transcriptional LysR family regulator